MALVGDRSMSPTPTPSCAFRIAPAPPHIDAPATRLVDLPAGPLNHHWTKNVIASADGATLYVTVGSNSNVAENGMEAERERAADLAGRLAPAASIASSLPACATRTASRGSRKPARCGRWSTSATRLGNDLVPDYMTSVHDGAFYGWPYSYYGQHVDTRVKPQRPDLVASALTPDYALGPHTASLGLAFYDGERAAGAVSRPARFIGQHGSWNRKPRSGYKVIFVPFADGSPPACRMTCSPAS